MYIYQQIEDKMSDNLHNHSPASQLNVNAKNRIDEDLVIGALNSNVSPYNLFTAGSFSPTLARPGLTPARRVRYP